MKKTSLGWIMLIVMFVVSLSVFELALAEDIGVANSSVVTPFVEKDLALKVEQKETGLSSCVAYFKGTLNVDSCRVGEVPVQAAIWLFVLALIAFVGLSNKKKV